MRTASIAQSKHATFAWEIKVNVYFFLVQATLRVRNGSSADQFGGGSLVTLDVEFEP